MYSDSFTVFWCSDDSCWHRVRDVIIKNGRFGEINEFNEKYSAYFKSADYYIFPGLIDSHVHIAEDPAPINEEIQLVGPPSILSDEQYFNQILRNLKKSIQSGVTTLRDAGSFGERFYRFKKWLKNNKSEGAILPRVFSAGAMIVKEAGHAAERGTIVRNPTELIEVIKLLNHQGASFIKILNDPIVFSQSEIDVAVRIASSLGLKTHVHTYTEEAATIAIKAKANGLEHPGNYSAATIRSLFQMGMTVTSTLIAGFDTVENPRAAGADCLFDDASLHIYREWYRESCTCIPELQKQGVRILCGTDAGFPYTDFDSIIRELNAMEMLGVPIEDCIKTATINPAENLGLKNILGEIREGAFADYMLFDRNPLLGPNKLKNPHCVYLEGRKVPTAQIIGVPCVEQIRN